MAIHNPANLYSNGQFTIDTSPFTKVVLAQQAKKAAAKEAINRSMRDMASKLNTAGVRQVDLEGDGVNGSINGLVQNWKNDTLTNQKEILKGGAAQQANMTKYQAALDRIAESKMRAKNLLEMGKAHAEGKLDIDEDDLGVFAKMHKSIFDPSSKRDDGEEYGWGDLPAKVGDFTPNDQAAMFNAATAKNQPSYDESQVRYDDRTKDLYLPKVYNKDQIKNIGDNAGTIFDGSMKAKKLYKKQLTNPDFFNTANPAFKEIYGRDIESPRDAAIADNIIRAKSVRNEEKIVDPAYKEGLMRRMKLLSASLRPKKEPKAAASSSENLNNLYGRIQAAYDDPQAFRIRDSKDNPIGFPFNRLPNDAQTTLMSSIKVSHPSLTGDDIYIAKEKDGSLGIYQVNSDNQPIPSNETRLTTISPVGTDLKVQPNTKAKEGVVRNANAQPAPAKSKGKIAIKNF